MVFGDMASIVDASQPSADADLGAGQRQWTQPIDIAKYFFWATCCCSSMAIWYR
jgi:hypothetical protein